MLTLSVFFNICDTKGNSYYADGTVTFVGDTDWYKSAVNGVSFITEPHISTVTKKLEVILAVPLFDSEDNVMAVLGAGWREPLFAIPYRKSKSVKRGIVIF